MSNDSDLRFRASGPELRGLGLPFGLTLLPDKTFAVSGEVNGTPTGFAFENLVARIGENDIVTGYHAVHGQYAQSEPYTNLHCGIYRWDIVDGIATIEETILQSDRLTILTSGSINFHNERLDLTLRSKPRKGFGISLGGVINSFLKLGGTLQNPSLNLDPASSVTTAGAAVATGGLSLLAKGLWDRLSAEKDLCAPRDDDKKK